MIQSLEIANEIDFDFTLLDSADVEFEVSERTLNELVG
jgi:hypothetical protein